MNWKDYAEDISLLEYFRKDIEPMSQAERYRAVRVLIDYFSKENLRNSSNLLDTYSKRREALRGLISAYPHIEIDSNIIEMLDRLLLSECREKNIVDIKDLESVENNIYIFNGDITTIKADAIVNAANSKLLGCLKPLHACIDNSIHSGAGPRLREDCNKIIEKQGHLEYTGSAKITRGYCLPSRFVIHTVGPIVTGNSPTKEQEKQLYSCYKSCLDITKDIDEIDSIVFCCISTGVFGYPKDIAANIAVNSVRGWINYNPNKKLKIIFNVFSEEDEDIYRNIFR